VELKEWLNKISESEKEYFLKSQVSYTKHREWKNIWIVSDFEMLLNSKCPSTLWACSRLAQGKLSLGD